MTNKAPSADLIEAIRLIKHGTGEHFYMWNLSGRRNAKLTHHALSPREVILSSWLIGESQELDHESIGPP